MPSMSLLAGLEPTSYLLLVFLISCSISDTNSTAAERCSGRFHRCEETRGEGGRAAQK